MLKKTYRELTALNIYKKYVSNLMSEKKLVFDPEIFQVFSDKVSNVYLIRKRKKRELILEKKLAKKAKQDELKEEIPYTRPRFSLISWNNLDDIPPPNKEE